MESVQTHRLPLVERVERARDKARRCGRIAPEPKPKAPVQPPLRLIVDPWADRADLR